MRCAVKTEAGWAKYEEVLLHCFLFSGFDAPRLSRVLSGRGEILTFRAGQTIFSPHCFKRAVGIFLKGKAQAEKAAEGRTVVLNRFEPPMMFGAAAVFRQAQEYVTQVTAKTLCQVLFLTDKELDAIFREDFAAARNYISFLSERIAFLTARLTASPKVRRKRRWPYTCTISVWAGAKAFPSPVLPPVFPGSLGISRATVYRALDHFCQLGYIRRDGAQLHILDAQGLLDWREPEA